MQVLFSVVQYLRLHGAMLPSSATSCCECQYVVVGECDHAPDGICTLFAADLGQGKTAAISCVLFAHFPAHVLSSTWTAVCFFYALNQLDTKRDPFDCFYDSAVLLCFCCCVQAFTCHSKLRLVHHYM